MVIIATQLVSGVKLLDFDFFMYVTISNELWLLSHFLHRVGHEMLLTWTPRGFPTLAGTNVRNENIIN